VLRTDGVVFEYAGRGSVLAAPSVDAAGGDGNERSGATDDGRPALDGVSVSIPDGQFRVLAGPNGSGKSTLVRLFVGLEEADAGTVRVDGRDPVDESLAVRTSVGVVFQNPRDQLVAATVGADVAFGPENLGLARTEIDRRVDEALTTVGMDGREDERVVELSGGERARVALAGVLAMEPDHLLLDEPFVGLDAPAREAVLDHVRALAATETTVVVVTHDLRGLLSTADHVTVLTEGQVALSASPAAARDQLPELGVAVPGEVDGREP
jgi:biotin transport system ATP-binding protein